MTTDCDHRELRKGTALRIMDCLRFFVLALLLPSIAECAQWCFLTSPSEQIGVYNPTPTNAVVTMTGSMRRRTVNIGPYETVRLPATSSHYPVCRCVSSAHPMRAAVLGRSARRDAADRIWTTHVQIAQAFEVRTKIVRIALRIGEGPEANARVVDNTTMEVNLALAARLHSDDELAFAIAHEFGHVYQRRTRQFRFREHPETDADAWAVRLMHEACYEPAAAIRALDSLQANIEMTSRIPTILLDLFARRKSGIAEEMRNTFDEPREDRRDRSHLRVLGRALRRINEAVRDWVSGAAPDAHCECNPHTACRNSTL